MLVLPTQHYTQAIETNTNRQLSSTIIKISPRLTQWTKCYLPTFADAEHISGHWPFFIIYLTSQIWLLHYVQPFATNPEMRTEKVFYIRTFQIKILYIQQLTIPHMERRAVNPRIYGTSTSKMAMQKYNVC